MTTLWADFSAHNLFFSNCHDETNNPENKVSNILMNMFFISNQKFSNLIFKLAKINTWAILLFGFLIQLGIMSFFAAFWWKDVSSQFAFDGFQNELITVVLLAPIIETLIFQYSIIDIAERKTKSMLAATMVSAFFFALIHVYSIQYVVATFFSGILFAIIFLTIRTKYRRDLKAIIYLTLLHALFNLFISMMKRI